MKFCPECGSLLNGKNICETCTYNLKTHKREKEEEYVPPIDNNHVIIDNTPRFGLLEDNSFFTKNPELYKQAFCPECGTLLNKGKCPNCNYKKNQN